MYEYKAVVSTQNQIMQVDANTGFSLVRQNTGFSLVRQNTGFSLVRQNNDFSLVRQNTGFSLVRQNATFLQHLQLDIHCETAGQWSFDFFI